MIEQLEFDGFTPEQAAHGVDAAHPDYMAQAVKKGKEYLDVQGFSRQGLIEQLEFDGFTPEQAAHGATGNGL